MREVVFLSNDFSGGLGLRLRKEFIYLGGKMDFRITENIYKQVIDSLEEGIRFLDRDLTVTYWNRGAEAMTGLKGSEVLGTKCGGSYSIHFSEKGENLCGEDCPVVKMFESGTTYREKVYFRHKDGYLVPVSMSVSPIRGSSGEVEGAMEMFNDISWKVAALQRIQELNKMAMLDHLTEIGNRRYGERAINAKIEEMKRYGVNFGILFIDIDDFKLVNDRYGHKCGDDFLKVISKSLTGCIRLFDTVCRWGGDEFIVLVTNMGDEEQLKVLADRHCALLEQSGVTMNDETVHATVSIGATVARPDDTLDTLIARADKLMYRNKAFGKKTSTLK
jgi:diguanylate cyclase (GGDEF)-like protein/PAS domain S-box-containing protein